MTIEDRIRQVARELADSVELSNLALQDMAFLTAVLLQERDLEKTNANSSD